MATALNFLTESTRIDTRLRRNADIIRNLADRFHFEVDLSLGQLVRPSDQDEPIQRWFHYREGYTVELCRRLIQPNDQFVLDPFCGFGSTLLAAKRQGIASVGFDVNPLAAFVSATKTSGCSEHDLALLEDLKSSLRRASMNNPAAQNPPLRILSKLFDPEILRSLSISEAIIAVMPEGAAKNLAKLCWLSILEGVSNTYREGNGLKYRNRVRKGNLYSVIPMDEWTKGAFPDDRLSFVTEKIIAALDTVIADLTNSTEGPTPVVVEGDFATSPFANKVTSAIFSPPYCNCFNYIKAYKLELWMGGFIKSYADIAALTRRGIRSRVESVTQSAPAASNPDVEKIARLVAEGELWSDALPSVVRGYFEDMTNVLGKIHAALIPGGRAQIVVGNSALAGVLIPTDLLLAAISENLGFRVARITSARHLTTSSQQRMRLEPLKPYLRESIIELTK